MSTGPYRTSKLTGVPRLSFEHHVLGAMLVVGLILGTLTLIVVQLAVLPLAVVIALIARVSGEQDAVGVMRGWLRIPLWPWLAADGPLVVRPAEEP